MHKANRHAVLDLIADCHLVWFSQSVDLLSHRQGRCIALPVPVLPFVLRVVEGVSIECPATILPLGNVRAGTLDCSIHSIRTLLVHSQV